jgi:anti-sigma B factor antagonist
MNQNSKFLVSNTSLDNVQLLHLHGYLDAHTAPDLENAISRIINAGHSNIIVSFKELDYISSAGLGVFMAFIEDVRDKGGDIKLCNMKPKVFSVFDLLGFPLLFDITNDEQLALSKFSNIHSDK